MKKILSVAVASVLLGVLYNTNAKAGKIKGGLIDTEVGSIEMVEEVAFEKYIYAKSLRADPEGDSVGRLIIVYPYGNFRAHSGAYRDRYGTYVRPPYDFVDKVLFVDRIGAIRGGIGLTKSEMYSLMRARPETFGRAMKLYDMVGRMTDEKLDAVRAATAAFKTDMDEDSQMSFFKVTVEMLVGKEFADAVNAVAECAKTDEMASVAGRDVEGLTPLAHGVYLVAEGDNGGFGLVNEGDNGGFGLVNEGDNGGFGSGNPIAEGDNGGFGLVNEGDNGGFGLVNEGDNGGFGSEAIVQGWSIDPDLPAMPNIDLNLGGLMFMLLE